MRQNISGALSFWLRDHNHDIMQSSSRPVLVVDPDLDFVESISQGQVHASFPVLPAHEGAAAQMFISDSRSPLSGIFVNPKTPGVGWISVIRCAHMHRPATPIYVLQDSGAATPELQYVDLKKLGVRDQITKPVDYKKMIRLLSPIVMNFDKTEIVTQGQTLEEQQIDSAYVPIRSEDFLSGSECLFDVFVRLSSDRFIKLLHAGEAFSPERLRQYLSKGVRYFYIRREVQDVYMAYCDHLTTALLKLNTVSTEIKLSQSLNLGEEVMKNLKLNGLSDSNLAYASKFVGNLKTVMDEFRSGNSPSLMNQFLNDTVLYEHGVATSMIAGVLGHAFKIQGDNPVRILGLAGMFHDLGLADASELVKSEEDHLMTPAELKVFREHPRRAVETLSKLRTLSSAALQGIEQHHMRLGGGGFPERSGATPVSKVAEIIGMADEYVRIMLKMKADPSIPAERLLTPALAGFTRESARVFIETFFPGNQLIQFH
jgi:response regulator RpfG family c-di-GMP phosphodiesterase